MGVERLIALIKESGGEPAAPAPDVYVVHQGDEAARLAFRLPRACATRASMSCCIVAAAPSSRR
jgi:histidyl-tRNA synthetase